MSRPLSTTAFSSRLTSRGFGPKGSCEHEQPAAGHGVAAVELVAHVEDAAGVVPLDEQQLVEVQERIAEGDLTLDAGEFGGHRVAVLRRVIQPPAQG